MGGWMADDPELAESLFIQCAPPELQEKLLTGKVEVYDLPNDIADPIWSKVDMAYANHLADIGDAALERSKYERWIDTNK